MMLLTFVACSGATKDLTTAEGTMAEADRLLKEEFYEEARKQYTRVKTEFPDSNLMVRADLKIAETYFNDESYKTAAIAYSEFLSTYPGHPEIAYVLYKLGLSYAKQMPSVAARDTRSARKALDTFTRLLIDYPNNEYSKEAQDWIKKSQHQLAEKIFVIADFYERQGKYEAAAGRFRELFDNYSDTSFAQESLGRWVRNLKKAGKTEEAEKALHEFKNEFPNSTFQP